MKKLIIILSIVILAGCSTTPKVYKAYLPHTLRTFHAKKNCAGCNDINPIVFESVQDALDIDGISPCSVCVKDKHYATKGQGYTVTNYATNGQGGAANSNMNYVPPAKSKGHEIAKFTVQALIAWAQMQDTQQASQQGINSWDDYSQQNRGSWEDIRSNNKRIDMNPPVESIYIAPRPAKHF